MAKKKKNSNYVTEKTELAKAKKQIEARNKKIKKNVIISAISFLIVAVIAAAIVLLGFAFGWWEEKFEVTYHAEIAVEGYGTIHIELYGEEAPETVNNFVSKAQSGFFNGMSFYKVIDGLYAEAGDPDDLYAGIYGEYSENGFENNISHKRGVISMARREVMGQTVSDKSSSVRFFIVHQDSPQLDGSYAAFGRVIDDGMDVIDKICRDAEPIDNEGTIAPTRQPIITSVSVHHSH